MPPKKFSRKQVRSLIARFEKLNEFLIISKQMCIFVKCVHNRQDYYKLADMLRRKLEDRMSPEWEERYEEDLMCMSRHTAKADWDYMWRLCTEFREWKRRTKRQESTSENS